MLWAKLQRKAKFEFSQGVARFSELSAPTTWSAPTIKQTRAEGLCTNVWICWFCLLLFLSPHRPLNRCAECVYQKRLSNTPLISVRAGTDVAANAITMVETDAGADAAFIVANPDTAVDLVTLADGSPVGFFS
jgi:hypothetical protein